MKNLIIVSILAISSISFAATNTCYKRISSKAVPAGVPGTLCMQDIGNYNNGDKTWIQIFGGNLAGVYETVSSLNETTARLVLVKEDGDYCQASRQISVVLKVPATDYTKLNLDKMKVSVEAETNRDTCHSFPEVKEFKYSLIK